MKTRLEAEKKAQILNNKKGYKLYTVAFVGESMVNVCDVKTKRYYLLNKESMNYEV